MKTYIACYSYIYEDTYIVGVFSSEEKAWEYLETNYKDVEDKHVEEWELDIGGQRYFNTCF